MTDQHTHIAHLETILDATTEKIFAVDRQYRLTYFNQAFAKQAYVFNCENPKPGMIALPVKEEVKKKWITDYYEKALEGQAFSADITYYTRDGVKRIDQLFFTPIYNGDEVVGCVINSREISDLRAAQHALSSSERKYRQLFERSLAGVFRTTLKGDFLECNESFARILGYDSKEELLESGNVYDIYFTKQERDEYLEKLKAKGVLQNYETRHKRKDGSEVWILANVTLGLDEMEQPAFVEGTFIDITELKQAGELLVESEERFRQISGIISDYAYSLIINDDREYHVQWIFGGFEQITGYSPNEITSGETFNKLIHPDDYAVLLEQAHQLKEQGAYHMKYRIIRKDGEVRWIEDASKVIRREGTVMFTVGAVKDITTERENEENLKKNERSMRMLLDSIEVGVIILQEGEVVYNNTWASELVIGLTGSQLTRNDVTSFLPHHLYEQVCRACDHGNPMDRVEFSSGNTQAARLIQIQGTQVMFGYQQSYCLVIQDITLQKQLAEEKARLKVAQHTNEALMKEIEDHRKTQRKLRGAERFSKYIIDSSLDMILASNKDGLITEINHAALRRFGYSTPELMGMSPKVLYADPSEFEMVFKALNDTGSFRGEITNITKKGEKFRTMLSASLLKNEEGKIVGAMGVSRDITELKKSERMLLEQSSMIRALFQSASNTLIFTYDKLFRLVSFNQNFKVVMQERFGLNVEKGMNVLEQATILIGNKEKSAAFQDYFENSLEGMSLEFEGPLRDKNNVSIWFEFYLNPVEIKDEGLKEVVCLAHDITEKKQAEKILVQREEQMKAMIQAIPDTIFRVNGKYKITGGRWVSANGVLDIQAGSALSNLFDSTALPLLEKAVDECLEASIDKQVEFTNNDSIYEARLSPINEEEALIILRDISQEKEAENQIRDSLREKEVLLKEVHHRVKNNLQIISSILNLQSSYVKDENTLDILKESQNRIKSMSYIHESLYQNKNFSKVMFSDYILNLSNNLVHSYQFTETAIDTEFELEELDLSLDQAIPCGLIINELITNALKYAFPNRKTGKLFLKLSQEDGQIRLIIGDDGVGLPAEVDFRNTDSLGLQLVITLVEQLDGTIEKQDVEGTSYLITFEELN